MAFRSGAIGDTRFDERLPLYGWQEDIDFAARVRRHGRLARTDAFAGVHCGIKTARAPGLPVGYAQVANPLYLTRKGTMRAGYSLKLIARNLAANHLKLLAEEPWVDRRGRARGNRLALRHALFGTLDPARILEL
jgi:GT2 family glycosyltransferase